MRDSPAVECAPSACDGGRPPIPPRCLCACFPAQTAPRKSKHCLASALSSAVVPITAAGLQGKQPLADAVNAATGSRQNGCATWGKALALQAELVQCGCSRCPGASLRRRAGGSRRGLQQPILAQCGQPFQNCHLQGESDCLIETKLRGPWRQPTERSEFCPVL